LKAKDSILTTVKAHLGTKADKDAAQVPHSGSGEASLLMHKPKLIDFLFSLSLSLSKSCPFQIFSTNLTKSNLLAVFYKVNPRLT
jgi:hypothetical protein